MRQLGMEDSPRLTQDFISLDNIFKRPWKAPGNLTPLPEARMTSRHSADSSEASQAGRQGQEIGEGARSWWLRFLLCPVFRTLSCD